MNPDSVDRTDRVPHGSSDDPDVLDFSANINPRTPPGTRAVYEGALDAARSYPPRGYPAFRTAAADYADCDPERVVPTGGGLQAIRLTIATHVDPGDSALLPAPSFGEYAREVRLQGGEPVFVAPGSGAYPVGLFGTQATASACGAGSASTSSSGATKTGSPP